MQQIEKARQIAEEGLQQFPRSSYLWKLLYQIDVSGNNASAAYDQIHSIDNTTEYG